MGVVDHYGKRLAFVDALESSRYSPQVRDAARDHLRRDAVRQAGAACGEDVVDVDAADKRRFHREAQLAKLHVEAQPVEAGSDVAGAQMGVLSKGVVDRFRLGVKLEPARIFIVAV